MRSRATTAVLLPDSGEPPEEFLLIPGPVVRTRPHDGRPDWKLSDPAGVVRETAALGLDLKIDYEHQGERAAKNGQPAPASGWIGRVFERGGAVWASGVQWTEKAAAHIRAKEYRFISAEFLFDPDSREVSIVTGASLTNDPALFMPALAGREREDLMDPEKLKQLAKALGLAEDATEEQILQAASARRDTKALAKALGLAEDATEEQLLEAAGTKALAKALGLPEDADRATIQAKAAELKATADPGALVPRAEYDRLAASVTADREARAQEAASAAVDAAVAAGKIAPAQKDWALGYATSDPDGFKAFAEAAPALVGGLRTATAVPPAGALTAQELATARAMGLDPEKFKAERDRLADRETAA